MTDRPLDLPDFENPPVTEVALGVQFSTLVRFHTVHAGYLWDVFRNDFPNVSEQPPLSPAFETFGTRSAQAGGIRLEMLEGPPMPRLWFLDRDETELVQFQTDRFIHNWRKIGHGAEYPRYEAIRGRFFDEVTRVRSFLERESIGDIQPNQCEVTYVNHIPSQEGEDLCANLGTVFRFWGEADDYADLASIENARIVLRHVITSDEGESIGRLITSVEPGRRADGSSMIRLTLVARGRPAKPNDEAVQNFFDLGRERIVRSFTAITTDQMHQRWGRIR